MDFSKYSKNDLVFIATEMSKKLPELSVSLILDRTKSRGVCDAIRASEAAFEDYAALMRNYDELIAPYVGKKIPDIPMDILTRASNLTKAIAEARRRWERLDKKTNALLG